MLTRQASATAQMRLRKDHRATRWFVRLAPLLQAGKPLQGKETYRPWLSAASAMKGHVSLSRTTVLLHSALREMKMPKGQSQAA
jgi:hypothetical protein